MVRLPQGERHQSAHARTNRRTIQPNKKLDRPEQTVAGGGTRRDSTVKERQAQLAEGGFGGRCWRWVAKVEESKEQRGTERSKHVGSGDDEEERA